MTAAPRRAVFLDRDGVLNKTFVRDGVTHPPQRLDDFEFLPGVLEATRRLADGGWPLLVVTNQPDVARGTQSREWVEAQHAHLSRHLPVVEVLTCYHDGADRCECRKPRPGMLLEAARRWNLDLPRSVMVGDRWSDVLAGQAAGCAGVLVKTPYSAAERCQPDRCVSDLPEAVAWILETFALRGVA